VKRKFPVVDADGHVIERDRELREFLPKPFRGVAGKREYPLFSWDGWARGALSPHKREHPDAKLWTRFLDATEIAATVLYPNDGLNIGLLRDADWAVALARAYNDWLHHDFLRVSPRFHAVALLAPQDPAAAAKELERATRDLGMVGGMLPAVLSPMRGYGLPQFDPIYAAAEKLDVPITVHGGAAVELGLDHMPSFAGVYPLSHPFSQMQQLTSMMIHGVFERFPRLRFAFLEAGCGWVPYLADRLDESWQHRGSRWPCQTHQSPGDIMRGGNLYYACEREEKTLNTVAQLIGGRQILWASDFPHEREWHEFSGDIDTLVAREDLAEGLVRQILFENPCRLYNLAAESFTVTTGDGFLKSASSLV
jgi:predicted TIM-barrel fold metal-dependent hydrolase